MLDKLKARWPKSDLEYVRLLATCALALVLLPLVVAHLILHPFDVADHAVRRQVGA